MANPDYDLFDAHGNRKYLTTDERRRFFAAIDRALPKPDDREKRTFALLLYYTGCRISEGLAVTHNKIDYGAGGVIFKTLKRRNRFIGSYRCRPPFSPNSTTCIRSGTFKAAARPKRKKKYGISAVPPDGGQLAP